MEDYKRLEISTVRGILLRNNRGTKAFVQPNRVVVCTYNLLNALFKPCIILSDLPGYVTPNSRMFSLFLQRCSIKGPMKYKFVHNSGL